MEPNVVLAVSVAALLGSCSTLLGHGAGSAPLTPSLEAFPSTALLLVYLHQLLWGFPPLNEII